MKSVLFAALMLLFGSLQAHSGILSPGLEEKMARMDEQDVLRVLVVLEDQADIGDLDKSLHGRNAPLAERHRAVVGSLIETAEASQADLIGSLSALEKASVGIVNYKPYWIVNGVLVEGTVAAIRELALRPDVEVIEAEMVIEPIEPMMIKEVVPQSKSAKDGFVAGGITAIGADRVWHELGIHGTGTIVANMDSGVDATHPALTGRWLGNSMPASHAWLDVSGNSPSLPVDQVGHGTHVMGTITGATAFDTLGVAPGAKWIATNGATGTSLEDFTNNVLDAFQWLADPDGNPNTSDDVPDVCQNSWGVAPGTGFPICDSTWWQVIDNCEAAGVVVLFSAGNEGPAPGTLRSPGDRADSPTNCFTVGSTAQLFPYAISGFSSRGPSLCGGPYAMKPELAAPGENIISSVPGGSYAYMDGTSMAGPHVAGVVALMRQAAPDLDVTTIKEILMDTAIDLGTPGEDNNYGHGLVDAYAAVSTVLNNTGTVSGTVTDAATMLPIENVVVRDTRGFARTVSAADGSFTFTILSGETTLRLGLFGYETLAVPVDIPSSGELVLNPGLQPLLPATVSGVVRGPDGNPLPGATIVAMSTPADTVISDGSGAYALTLPSGPEEEYDLLAMAPNLAYAIRHTGLSSSLTVDFDLPVLQSDGFESGGFATFDWQRSGNQLWNVVSDEAQEGVRSARTGAITHSQSTQLEMEFFVHGDGEFSFWYKVDSETSYDVLRFYLNGVLEETWSGAVDWTRYSKTLPTGNHEFLWVYSKDSSASVGQDAAWIDLVEFPGTGVQPLPALTLGQTVMNMFVDAGSVGSAPLLVGNGGDMPLDYAVVASAAKSTPAWLSFDPTEGTVYPNAARNISVMVDAFQLSSGVHQADFVLNSTDPDHPDTTITVNVTVNPVSAVDGDLPQQLVLHGAVPNPFNPTTEVRFSLPAGTDVTLRIYDVSGRLVRTLVDGPLTAGHHGERWNGQDRNGKAVASGIYYARIDTGGVTSIKPMTLVR